MSTAYTGTKPQLSFWQIWNMSFGFLGIQFGWGLQMANMSSIYERLGASAGDIPMLWLAAPLTGLLVQPIIGYLSDRTWSTRFGRRKPYFFIGALLASTVLIFMPNSSSLWMAAGLLWIMDASINISMEPFRAFVADMLPEKQHTQGFTMQSFFIGVGAVVASAMPWMLTHWFGVSAEAAKGEIPLTVKLSFYTGAVVFLSAVLYTCFTVKEYPPVDISETQKKQAEKRGLGAGAMEIFNSIFNMPKTMRQLALVQFFTWPGLFLMWFYFGVSITRTVFHYDDNLAPYEAYYDRYAAGEKVGVLPTTFAELADSTNTKIEKAEDRLTGAELQTTFGTLEQMASVLKENKKRQSDGGDWGGLCFAFYSIITFMVAFLLPVLAGRIGKKYTHMLCLSAGAVGLLSVGIIEDQYMLFLSMAGVGIAWASILSMPYAMLAPALPAEKVGIYMGIFNFFIVIPEIIASLFFGWFMTNVLHDNRVAAVMLGGVLFIVAALLTSLVKEHSVNEAEKK